MATVTMKGATLTLSGREAVVGDTLPDVTLVDGGLGQVSLASLRGKPLILAAVPSLDTSVCSIEARKFDKEAGELAGKVTVVVASMDLPFAQKRWADQAGVHNLTLLSDHRAASLGEGLGILLGDLRLLARAVYVADKNGKIVYRELVPEVTDEPDYAAAVAAARKLG